MGMDEILKALQITEEARIGESTSSEYSAEGGTPTFDRIPFRVRAGARPNLNAFVIVLREDEPVVHYGRIVAGSELNVRATPAGIQKDQAYGLGRSRLRPSEQSPELVRIMEIEVLGEISPDGSASSDRLIISEPRRLPQTGQPVYELPADLIPRLLGTPTDPQAGLELGVVVSGGKTAPFLLPIKAVARHIAILGKTGTGKSYAAGVLMEELHDKDIPILSFDVLGDNEQAAVDLKGLHIQAGTEDFRIPYSIVGWEEFHSFIPNLTSDQREILAVAYGEIYDRAMDRLEQGRPLDIPYEAFFQAIQEVGNAIGSKATPNALRRARAALRRSALLTDRPATWPDELARQPLVNIYVGHLGQQGRNLVVGAASRILQRLRRRDHIPPFVLMVDEAHLFLPGGIDPPPSTRVLREMIRTARHDSIGVVLLTQSPASMDRQILLTCNTRFIFALDPDDLRVVAGQLGDLPEETVERIPRLAQGSAVISSGMDLMRHPVIVRIRTRRRTVHVAETPNLAEAVQEWKASHGRQAA